MRERISAAIFCLWMAATPAAAMQCARASTPLEKTLCSNGQLAAADRAMAEAYFKLLHAIDDPSIRTSLIASQRRWLAARESDLGELDQADGFDRRTQRSVLLAVTRQRTRDLQARTDGQPQFVVTAFRQRALASAYSGGPFAGYRVECSFMPDQQNDHKLYYSCFGSHAYQQGDRVCSQSEDFASYTVVTTRAVGRVEKGRLTPVATCAFGGNDQSCPDADADQLDAWNTHPTTTQFQTGYGDGPRLEVDPDLGTGDEDSAWFSRCLTAPSYPPSATGDRATANRAQPLQR
ncbi:MAG TPA: lysozyme inhibitor LprI family protein [Dyella sp.]|nr:lysozyme inhibitor LprI family protein [Dyella sp.]